MMLLRLALLCCFAAAPLPLAAALMDGVRGSLALRAAALLALWLALESLCVVGTGATIGLGLPQLAIAELALLLASRHPVLRERVAFAWVRFRRDAKARLAVLARRERLALSAVAAIGCGAAAAMVLAPSGDYDTWMYQLPQVAEWMQHGLGACQEEWARKTTFEAGIAYYPGDWTALTWLCCATLRSDVLAEAPNLVAWLTLGLSCAALARSIGATRPAAIAGAAAVMAVPMAGLNLDSCHVDLGQGALVATALALACAAVREGCRVSLLACAVVLAMLIGTKMSGLPQVAVVAAAAAAAGPLVRDGRVPQRTLAVVCGSAIAVLGLWWYARNIVLSGNPLGFVAVPRLGWHGVIDADYIKRTSLLHTFHPGNIHHWMIMLGSLAAVIGPLAPVGVAAGTLAAWRLRTRPVLALVFAALALAALYIDGPWSGKHAHDPDLSWWLGQQLRYTWSLWAVVAALAAAGCGAARWCSPSLLVGCALAGAVALPWLTWAWWAAAPSAALGALAMWRMLDPKRDRPVSARLALVAGLAALALAVEIGEPLRWHLLDRRGYGVPAELELRLAPGEPVACWGTHQSWLLYGRHLEHRVRWFDLDAWRDGAGTSAEAAAMCRALAGEGVRYLATGPRWRDFPRPPTISSSAIPSASRACSGIRIPACGACACGS